MMNTRTKQKLNIAMLVDGAITRMWRNRDKEIFVGEEAKVSKLVFDQSFYGVIDALLRV